MSEENRYTTPPPPPPTASAPAQLSEMDQRNWAMFTHLSALTGIFTGGLGFILGPLILWLIKKDQMPQVNEAGKEALNFQLTMLIALLISLVLIVILIGFPLMFAVGIFDVVMVIIAAVQTSNGTRYRYPLTIRFIN
ncbi:MAG: DUF4870 domain-containing protein [Metallibacterium sp.]